MKRKVLIGFFWKFGEQLSSQMVSFVLSIILARLLSPTDYGVVALVNVFIVIADVFVTSGFGTSLIQKKDSDETDFSTIFYLSEIVSIIIYLLIFISAPWIAKFYNNSQLTLILRVFALKLPLSAFNGIQQAYISKHLMFEKVFVSTTIAAILSGIIGISMAYLDCGVWSLIGQYLSNTIFISVTLAAQIKWYPKWRFSWKAGKPLLDFGWKMLATDLLGQIFNQLRSLILGKVYTSADLAYYNRGQRFPDLVSTNIDGTLSTVLFPTMSKYNDDLNEIKKITRKSIRTSTFVIMPLLFGMAATSRPIVLLLLTKKWIATVPLMQILCFSDAFDTVSNTNMQALKAVGRSDILLKLELIKKPIYLFLLVIGIKISIYAVAYTMVVYNILAVLINMAPNRKLLNYSFIEQLSDILPALLNSILMYCVVMLSAYIIKAPLLVIFILQIFIGISTYIFMANIFKMDAFNGIIKILDRKIK